MGFLNALDISGSAMTAERFRMNIASQNISGMNITRTEEGGPYRRRQVVFEERPLDFKTALKEETAKMGVGGVRVAEVVENDSDFVPVYNPTHPDADENGYVLYPNVNRTEEQADIMAASRAYEANLTAFNLVKATMLKALEIGK